MVLLYVVFDPSQQLVLGLSFQEQANRIGVVKAARVSRDWR